MNGTATIEKTGLMMTASLDGMKAFMDPAKYTREHPYTEADSRGMKVEVFAEIEDGIVSWVGCDAEGNGNYWKTFGEALEDAIDGNGELRDWDNRPRSWDYNDYPPNRAPLTNKRPGAGEIAARSRLDASK